MDLSRGLGDVYKRQEIDNKKLESAFKVLGGSDTDMHTDVHYTPENNPNNYQEIYNNNNPTYFQSHNK
jgi:hypothetical protein